MTESEIMQAFLAYGQVVVSLFSMFFAMISAYIAGLYLFLKRADRAAATCVRFSVGWPRLPGRRGGDPAIAIAWAKVPSLIFSIGSLPLQ